MIVETVFIHRDVPTVYSAFFNLEYWKQALLDVLNVNVLYDDGIHQEFLMTVERPNGAETVRGIRFCTPNKRIELFQPLPPPMFSRMVGVWTFQEVNGGTEVKAERWFRLKDNSNNNSAEDTAGEKLRVYLKKNLGLFKDKLEK